MRTRITLECTECKQRNYNTTKDKKTHPDRVETKKYCKFCQKHTLHKETKQFELMEGKKMAEATRKKVVLRLGGQVLRLNFQELSGRIKQQLLDRQLLLW